MLWLIASSVGESVTAYFDCQLLQLISKQMLSFFNASLSYCWVFFP